MKPDSKKFQKIHLFTSEYCSQKCLHCPSSRLFSDNDNFSSLDDLINEFEAQKNKQTETHSIHLVLTGGEPLEHPRILEIIKYFSARVDFLSLSTNGLITNKFSKILLDKDVCALLDEIAISTEMNSDRYQELRQTDSYFAINKLAYVLKLNDKNLIISANIVVDKELYNNLETNLLKLDKTPFDRIKLIPYREIVNDGCGLTPMSWEEFKIMKKLVSNHQNKSSKIYSVLGSKFKKQYKV